MRENIKDLVKLIQENPDLPVISMVEQESVSDNYGYTAASFGRAYIEEYTIFDEKYYDDRESFKEDYYDYHDEELSEKFNYKPLVESEENSQNERLLDEYLDNIADQYFKRAIVVYIHPYDEELEVNV